MRCSTPVTTSACDAGGARVGAAICYDLRFPELYSVMATACNAIVTIANWTERWAAHCALLRARAIENQCYIFGVNRVDDDGNGLNYVKTRSGHPRGSSSNPKRLATRWISMAHPTRVANNREELTVRDKRYPQPRSVGIIGMLNEKVVVVTGGGGLLGQCFCEAIAANGGRTVVADINLEQAEAISAGICRNGREHSGAHRHNLRGVGAHADR